MLAQRLTHRHLRRHLHRHFGISCWMVQLVFRPSLQVQRTICPSVSPRAATRLCAVLRHRSPSASGTDTDTPHRHRQTGRQTHTHKKKYFRGGPGPASTEVEAPIPDCGATRATAEPGQTRPFSSCRKTCLVSFVLLAGHGSGSNISVTASEIKYRNPGIFFCNGNFFSKPGNLYLQPEKNSPKKKNSVCSDFREHGRCPRGVLI